MDISCVVVGAGAAGLAVSRALAGAGVEHVVLERDDVADTWRNQRWDSFRLNTPGWMNTTLGPVQPDSFCSRDEVVRLLVDAAASLPVRTHAPVLGVDPHGSGFVVRTPGDEIRASAVVLASGLQNVPNRPAESGRLTRRLRQIHTGDYRSAAQLPAGAVLVVGGAQSGCQIAEDLALAGRRVYLSTSRVGRYPWTYRGREMSAWLADCGFWDQRPQDLADPAEMRTPTPVVASGGRSLGLPALARLGVTLLGRFGSADGETVGFEGSPAANVAFGDQVATRLRTVVDAHIDRRGIDAAPAEPDSGAGPVELVATTELDLAAAGVTSVVWCTGFTGDLSWARLPILDADGRPRNDGCASPVPGVWFVGFPWLTSRSSGILRGLPGDAADVAAGVVRHLGR